MYSFSYLEPVHFYISSSNCCFLSCIQVSQEAGKVVWYSHLSKNFPQFVVIYTVKGFSVVNEAERSECQGQRGVGIVELMFDGDSLCLVSQHCEYKCCHWIVYLKWLILKILWCTHFTTIENNVICRKTLTGMLSVCELYHMWIISTIKFFKKQSTFYIFVWRQNIYIYMYLKITESLLESDLVKIID